MMPDPPDEYSTVFCQTCGEWDYPSGSCARSSNHETSPGSVMRLRREGPLTGNEFESTSYESKKKHGIAKLEFTAHEKGTKSTFGRTHSIYYLTHEHTPEDVIEKWITANRDILKGRGLTTENITRALSKQEFKKAWKQLCETNDFEVLDESDHTDRGGDHSKDTDCPFCGKTIKTLPGHLPQCPAK